MLVFDSNHLDALLFDHPRGHRLVARLENNSEHQAVTTIINAQEKMEGWLAKINGKNMTPERQVYCYAEFQQWLFFFAQWTILPFDDAAAVEFERLKKSRVNIGTMDLKIAAIALCHDAIVLTRDSAFRSIEGLKVEDWLLDDSPDEPPNSEK